VTTFYLVRHGVTSHTGHKLTGWMEGVGLSSEGRAQAEGAAAMLAGAPLRAIYSSPIDRCWQTAEIVAARHPRLEVRATEEIGEVRYGTWTGRTLKSLAKLKLWEVVQRFPSGMTFPEGESLRAVQARAVNEIEVLRQRHPKASVCCVTHADVIKLVLAHYLGVHIDLYQRIAVAPASVSAFSVSDRGPYVLGMNWTHPGGADA
jgi:probable phosphomutase (TIGR03848 family)